MALLSGAAAIAGYLLVWKPLEAVVHDWGECASSLRAVRTMDDQLANEEPFEEPADGVLRQDQVSRFVDVQRAVAEADVTWENLSPGSGGSYRELVSRCVELGAALESAKAVQVAALDSAGFSAAEYFWVRNAFFAATGKNLVPFEAPDLPSFDMDFDSVSRWREFDGFERLRSLGGSVTDAAPGVPEPNVALVEPYRAEARAWVVHAVMGL